MIGVKGAGPLHAETEHLFNDALIGKIKKGLMFIHKRT